MSVYTASYFRPENHHGEVVSISISQPQQFRSIRDLEFFHPTQLMLAAWKAKTMAWEDYEAEYWRLLGERRSAVEAWLGSLTAANDLTLCCWEHDDTHCHRRLVAKVVEKYRSDLYGGREVPLVEASAETPSDAARPFQVGDKVTRCDEPPNIASFFDSFGQEFRTITHIDRKNDIAQVAWVRTWIPMKNLRRYEEASNVPIS